MKYNLTISKLSAHTATTEILHEVSLKAKPGETIVIMGQNGAGKSTLLRAIAGVGDYTVSAEQLLLGETNLLKMKTDQRARAGLFLSYQEPIAIPGLSYSEMLRSALEVRGEKMTRSKYQLRLAECFEKVGLSSLVAERDINAKCSGGEKKKLEIAQILMTQPTVALLDEIDSGLDVDALKIVGKSVTKYFNEENPGILLVTHYQRLLDYIKPTHVHIMSNGHIIKSGNKDLVKIIEKYGYDSTNIIEENI